jgi:hypothetical protein
LEKISDDKALIPTGLLQFNNDLHVCVSDIQSIYDIQCGSISTMLTQFAILGENQAKQITGYSYGTSFEHHLFINAS